MTTAFRLRITTFASLIAISFAVHGPSVSSAVELGSLGRVSNDALGICTPDQVTNLASADNGEALYAFLDDRVVMSAFDTPQEYAAHVMGIHYADPAIGFATTDGDSQRIQARHASGGPSASPMARSASAHGGLQQRASLQATNATSGIAQNSQGPSPVSGGNEADRLVNVASPAEDDVAASARPADDGRTTSPGKQGEPGPAKGSQDANPVTDVAQAGRGDSPASTLPGEDGSTRPGPPASNPSPSTGIQPTNPIIIAKAGEDDGLDPYIKGKGTPDLIAPPDWVGEPTAGGSAPGTHPAAACDSGSTCDTNQPVASNAVPEPGSMALLGLGMMGLAWARRRKASNERV